MQVFDDLRFGIRSLAKHRGVTAAAVFSLCLGVGANSTVFTLLNAVLFRPLPVKDASRVAALYTVDPRNPGLLLCSYPNYRDYAERNTVFSSLLLHTVMTVNLTGHGDPKLLMGQLVSGNYFSTLGVNPVVGRGFLPEEDVGALPVAVLSHRLWTNEFGRDPGVTSHSIHLNGQPYRIVGVAPEGFEGLNQLYTADVWAPVGLYQRLYPNPGWVNQRRALIFGVAGRLKDGLSLRQAEAGMDVLARDLEREHPAENAGRRIRLVEVSDATLAPQMRTAVTKAVAVLLIVSSLVLLIACANVANLLLARACGRSREIAVRLAVGASRPRLVQQFLVESLLLAGLGGAAGLIVAGWARSALWSLRPSTLNHAGFHLDLDATVVAYTLGVSLLTGLVFGLAPALRSTRSDLTTDLKDRTGLAAMPGRTVRARSALVAMQMALSAIALIGAGLFLKSIRNATRLDLGFDATRLAAVSFNVGDQGYNQARGREYQRRALEAARSVPGVQEASLAKDVPFHVSAARTVLLDGQEDFASGQGRVTLTGVVWPGYFRTLGIPLLRGRDFAGSDTEQTPRVAIINEAAAAQFWPGQEAIGRRLHFFGDSQPAEVVGVARNATYREIGEGRQPFLYLSLEQYYFPTAAVYVRTAGDPEAAAAAVRRALQPLDRNLLLQAEGFRRTMREMLWTQRLSAGLLSLFGVLALLLATVGIYGVVSHSVGTRVREIGVRMAMGATPGDLQRMIMREGFLPVALGTVAGLSVAVVAARWVEGMLFGTSPHDPATFVTVPAALALVALAACWIPAWRATRMPPANALREE